MRPTTSFSDVNPDAGRLDDGSPVSFLSRDPNASLKAMGENARLTDGELVASEMWRGPGGPAAFRPAAFRPLGARLRHDACGNLEACGPNEQANVSPAGSAQSLWLSG